ncbi:MAG: EamA family transporter [Anaerolineae bacterium]|nr:EamA family transporter [Anaerolineae bacterium]
MIPKVLASKLPQAKRPVIPGDLNWADGLLLLTVFFWGVNFSVVKVALLEIPPLLFNGLRFAFTSALMLVLTLATGHRLKFQRRHLPYLIGLGLLGNTAYQLFFILGIAQTTADNSALILATVPAWVALFGTLAGVEQVRRQGWLGVILSLGGIALIILGSNHQVDLQFGGATLRGDVLILLGTLCWSTYTLAIRPVLRHYPSAVLTSFSTLMGTIPLILLATPSMLAFHWRSVSGLAWSALIISGTFGITLAYFFWNYGVSRLGSARTSFYSNLSPPISLLVAWLWLGETLTPLQWGGALLALAGVVLSRRYTFLVSGK